MVNGCHYQKLDIDTSGKYRHNNISEGQAAQNYLRADKLKQHISPKCRFKSFLENIVENEQAFFQELGIDTSGK